MKKCLNCGKIQDEEVMFCLECGSIEFEDVSTKIDKNNLSNETANINIDNKYEEIDNFNFSEENPNEVKKLIIPEEIKENLSGDVLYIELLNNKEEVIYEWKLSMFPSYTVGRISSAGKVDIDLSPFEGKEYISRKHGKFFKSNNKWYYMDTNSKHGTELVNRFERIDLIPEKEYALSDNDILILAGKIKLRIRFK